MRFHGLAFAVLLVVAAQTRAELCDPADPTLLKPDLVALAPRHVRVLDWNIGRRVFFTTAIGNVGDGALVVRGETVRGADGPFTRAWQQIKRVDGTTCEVAAGEFELHIAHAHWHLRDFADYLLRKDDPFTGEIVAKSEKVSFCLLDIERLLGFSTPRTVLGSCSSQTATQGISVGFADVYESLLPGQFIDLDADPEHPVPEGDYYLVNVANPAKVLWEVNDDPEANSGVVSVHVPASHLAPPPSASPSPTASPQPTPARPKVRRPARPTRLPRPSLTPSASASPSAIPTPPAHVQRPPRQPRPAGPHG
jgi:hypothetical protein